MKTSLFCGCGNEMEYDSKTKRARCYACKPVQSRNKKPQSTPEKSTIERVVTTQSTSTQSTLGKAAHSREIPPRAVERQGTLAFERASKGQAVKVNEDVVEREVDGELGREGIKFLNTTVRYPYFTVECPHCRRFHKVRNKKGTGQDKGIPDRLLYDPAWTHSSLPASFLFGVEYFLSMEGIQ